MNKSKEISEDIINRLKELTKNSKNNKNKKNKKIN